jgi:uncharacterized RDD family membrane protein YckC
MGSVWRFSRRERRQSRFSDGRGPTGSLILLFALFNRRRRTLHDVLTGMLMLRRPNGARTGPGPWQP